jgi:SAM-dependent methyltransferase
MTHTDLTPEPIMRLAAGFMAAKHLFAANELGLFEALADSPATIESLAARTGLTVRAARIGADAMVALGLLERDGDRYRNGLAASAFLAGRPGPDLRPALRFWDKISYPAWEGLAEALARGPRQEIVELDEGLQEIAAAGIEAFTTGPAAALAGTDDVVRHRRLLDIGGGTGSWSIALVRRHDQLRAAILELPAVAEVARKRVAAAGLAERIEVLAGDALAGDLPTGFDLFLVANLVHYFSPEQNRELLRRVRQVAGDGARLLLADFWTDATHTEPVLAALMAGEFATHIRNGDVYSVDEVRGWLHDTGWQFASHTPLAGPFSLISASVVEPAV